MDNTYTKVNVYEYVSNGLKNGTMVPITAIKFSRIIARPGIIGETVISWSVDAWGNEIKERESQVTADPQTNNPGWVVTKVDETGNIIIDQNGHENSWIINDSTFRKKYEIDPENKDLYKPTGGPQLFVQINDNIILNQWGDDMMIAAGGYINITNPNDMYGISERDFNDTYRVIDTNGKAKK